MQTTYAARNGLVPRPYYDTDVLNFGQRAGAAEMIARRSCADGREAPWSESLKRGSLAFRHTERGMPITPFLNREGFDPEAVSAMGSAFEKVCARLNLSRQAGDLVTQLVAAKIINFAQQGLSDPDALCERVLQEFSGSATAPETPAP